MINGKWKMENEKKRQDVKNAKRACPPAPVWRSLPLNQTA
jgi:hypothetical protein